MGLRSAAYICMRTTSAIRFICQKNGIQILNYLDDLAGCEKEHYCNLPLTFLENYCRTVVLRSRLIKHASRVQE
jgi:hypothetical protein